MLPNPMPLAALLGIEVEADGESEVRCLLRVRPEHLNQGLVTHGGVLFTLADTALGLLVNRPGAASTWMGTAFSMQLYRVVRAGDVVRATATVENRSRRLVACTVALERLPDHKLIGVLSNQLLEAIGPGTSAGDAAQGSDGRPAVTIRTDELSNPLVHGLWDSHDRENGLTEPAGATGLYLVAEIARQPVGGLHMWMDDEPGTAYADRLWVHPTRRGQGVEDTLLDAVHGAAGEAGNAEVQLVVHGGDSVALRAAARAGYGDVEDFPEPAPEPGTRILVRALDEV